MRILDFRPVAGRPVAAHDSVGVTARAVVRGEDSAVTVLHVAAGGEIGRHPAPVDQLFVVVAGRAWVQGGDEAPAELGPGQAAVWRAGEEHVTRAVEALTALVVEMAALPLAE
jgi:quercetin dioxygenase-like cupin family protein